MPREYSFQDVVEVIQSYSEDVSKKFTQIEKEISGIKGEITGIKGEISGIKAKMVTKDYLDDKLADLRGDLIVLSRKMNTKFSTLIESLVAEKSLDLSVARKLLAMGPFPQG